jgi:hypothetical protein
MGYVPGEVLEQAAAYLLRELREQGGSVLYSHFYDGTDARHEEIVRAMGFEDDWYSPELLLDEAAGLLARAGLVELQPRATLLTDGENDYAIVLTQSGVSFAASNAVFACPDLDL